MLHSNIAAKSLKDHFMNPSSKAARTVRFTQTGGPEVLTIEMLEIAAPGPQEVRIQVKAIGLNRADQMYRIGRYMETPVFPSKIGYEAAGIVESVGAEVKDVRIGEVVSVVPAFSLNQYATYGELILVPAYTIRKHPGSLSFEEAASVWTSFLSMYGLVVEAAKVKAGQYVVLTAASSSAGLAGIQVVNCVGGVSIAVTTSSKKREALQKAGAQHVIVAGEQDVAAEIRRITADKGADIVLDPVAGPLFADLVRAIAENGQVFVYGALSQEPAVFPALDVLLKTPTIKGYTAMDVMGNPVVLEAAVAFIYDGIAKGKLKPVIGKVFPLDQIVEATRFMESNQQVGKVVVTIRG
jgi:NADPH:quinone reductase-like Zn-dependent oxidoreductase